MTKQKGPYCGGKLRKRDGTCTRPPGWGTNHPGTGKCKLHGGCAPSSNAAAITQQAERLLYQYDSDPVANPLEALQALAGRALALEQAIGEMVNNLKGDLRYDTETGGEQLRAEVAVLERAMDRCGRLLVDIAKLNIEERMARVTELQIKMVEKAFNLALRDMALPPERQKEARQAFGRHLRAV